MKIISIPTSTPTSIAVAGVFEVKKIGMAEQGIDVGVKYLGNGGEQNRGGNAFAALPFADGFGGIPQTLSQLDLCQPRILAKLL